MPHDADIENGPNASDAEADYREFRHAQLHDLAHQIGVQIEAQYPRVSRDGIQGIDPAHVEPIADAITTVVAEILQVWLDAGSERDVTFEEVGPTITDHVKGWSL